MVPTPGMNRLVKVRVIEVRRNMIEIHNPTEGPKGD